MFLVYDTPSSDLLLSIFGMEGWLRPARNAKENEERS